MIKSIIVEMLRSDRTYHSVTAARVLDAELHITLVVDTAGVGKLVSLEPDLKCLHFCETAIKKRFCLQTLQKKYG